MQDPTNIENLPYRPGVGMMIVNKDKKIFIAKRKDTKLQAWQMPQGGIDQGETPSRAAIREMEEEIGNAYGRIISESANWYSYDIPKFLIQKLWEGNYKGQIQKWFLIEYTGQDNDINLNTENPEFTEWRWASIQELPSLIIPFKKKLYDAVIKEFAPFI